MNGEQNYLEILQGQARIETNVANLLAKMNDMCDFKEEALQIFQEFNDYKIIRKDLPSNIISLQQQVDKLKTDGANLKEATDINTKELATLKTWANKASGVQIVVSVVIVIIVTVSPIIIWWLGAR
jgi:hypothetical protein